MSFHILRSSFIFRTQIKIFLMKSERFLSLHTDPMQLQLSRYRKVGKISLKYSMWLQWFNLWSDASALFAQKKQNRKQIFIKKIFIYVLKMNESLRKDMRVTRCIFSWSYPFDAKLSPYGCLKGAIGDSLQKHFLNTGWKSPHILIAVTMLSLNVFI